MDLYRQQIQRERYLLTVYKLANGDTHEAILGEDILKNLGMEEDEANKLAQYLEDEQLLECHETVYRPHRRHILGEKANRGATMFHSSM